ncbi:hypothetical protein CLAFUW4_12090 [Fulvia fulva]|uniref:Uncharacterized protein n=1 Tax=Passalora fulva TaxID=5499 RepID=A0A9Q8PDR1_PASFU|nr:uncharacterized protein CLAFUR5_11129 [Fulvia fulva]KAK4617541.1 hypothetical protein CLAFUR4_12095 [Fulvia fulva]KAK4618943.1 hypothetical protein CLAFUR0_12106 [Fulvia fulva]UJO20699.1 hypothetical protein CLAFUR5_11129 [Fulvia fulva]WPV17905.1 hypothetical protein CLAFUW4_12090 [Fulvia fulva]WPV32870.1 hypothetical protein CLAFUW7_12097 [Fulvia fulva]
MKFTLTLLTGLVASTVSGLTIPNAQPETGAGISSSSTDAQIIKSTWSSWYADVATVSYFLDNVASKKYKSQTAYLAAAQGALAAETGQTAYQRVLNQELSQYEGYKASNSTLSDGTWTNVKSYLEQLTKLDFKKDCTKIQEIVKKINYGDDQYSGRCSVILPAIDTYFALAYKALLDPQTPGYTAADKGFKNWQKAIRPRACASKKERDLFDMDVQSVEDILE